MKRRLERILIGLIVAVFSLAVIVVLARFTPLANVFIAWATLMLAFAAFMSILHSREQERRRREEGLLNEILQWATDVAQSAISRQTMAKSELWKTKLEHKYSRAKSKYIAGVASLSFNDLSPFITNITAKLETAIEATTQYIEGQGGGKPLTNYERELTESVEELIAEIAKVKTKNIG